MCQNFVCTLFFLLRKTKNSLEGLVVSGFVRWESCSKYCQRIEFYFYITFHPDILIFHEKSKEEGKPLKI